MQKNTAILSIVLALLVGTIIGYSIGETKSSQCDSCKKDMSKSHVIPGGEMMHDDEMMSMSEMMHSMNAQLEGKTGDEFDKAFLREMIIHHQGAIEMAQLALTNAKHQELKSLAQAIISAQNTEIVEMKGWQKDWYNE